MVRINTPLYLKLNSLINGLSLKRLVGIFSDKLEFKNTYFNSKQNADTNN